MRLVNGYSSWSAGAPSTSTSSPTHLFLWAPSWPCNKEKTNGSTNPTRARAQKVLNPGTAVPRTTSRCPLAHHAPLGTVWGTCPGTFQGTVPIPSIIPGTVHARIARRRSVPRTIPGTKQFPELETVPRIIPTGALEAVPRAAPRIVPGKASGVVLRRCPGRQPPSQEPESWDPWIIWRLLLSLREVYIRAASFASSRLALGV